TATPAFQDAVGALYAVAYTAKFMVKRSGGEDYRLTPLEGLWWAGEGPPRAWDWTLMIMQPDHVSAALIEHAAAAASARRPLAAIERVRLERFAEGLAAQVLHLGPYAEEGPTIERLHAFIAECGRRPRGRHHEIYLGDP